VPPDRLSFAALNNTGEKRGITSKHHSHLLSKLQWSLEVVRLNNDRWRLDSRWVSFSRLCNRVIDLKQE
jgi:hypothetical protein